MGWLYKFYCLGIEFYELLFGYTPRYFNDSYLSNEVCVDESRKDFSVIRSEASENIQKQQSIQQKYYFKKRCAPNYYKVG